jgi:hypothetical protein
MDRILCRASAARSARNARFATDVQLSKMTLRLGDLDDEEWVEES